MAKTSIELFNEARERGDTICASFSAMQHDERQADLLPPVPAPAFLCLVLDGHRLGVTRRESDKEYVACCSCKERWTFKANQTTREMEAIFTAHVAYFKRDKLTTL